MTNDTQVCSRCIYDSTIPNIEFDEAGVCNYCHQIDEMEERFPNDERGKQHLDELVAQIKKDGKHRRYDAVIGVRRILGSHSRRSNDSRRRAPTDV